MTIFRDQNCDKHVNLDVAIIGGGPAAAICALELKRKDIHVGIIFGGNYRSTIELISGRAQKLLEQVIKKPISELVGGIEIYEIMSLWNSKFPVTFNSILSPFGPSLAVNRNIFDHVLLQIVKDANIEIFSNTFVKNVKLRQNHWEIYLPKIGNLINARFIALATGRSKIYWLDRMVHQDVSSIVLSKKLITKKTTQDNTFYIEATKNGWWYSLPDINHTRFVGYCITVDTFRKRNLSTTDFFCKELDRTQLIRYLSSDFANNEPIKGQFTQMQTYDKIAGHGWISLGDAAFAPDPLSGMGLEFAVESACFGAQVLCNGLDEGSKMNYERWIHKNSIQHKKILDFYLN